MSAEPTASRPTDRVRQFADRYAFPLDDFQVAGVTALAEGRSTLVAAPTGAGKTVVGEFAVWHALERGRKCFYTTPIKALSNQKFHDLGELHGPGRVGLLTGDNAVNGSAPIVVMTTEVLRNMLYEDAPALDGLESVVLDEVHYLADPERGAVWEEIIIQLPATVQLACLSATVSNAEEFGAWIKQVRASCDVVITDRRPVPLEHHYAIGERVLPVFKEPTRRQQSDGAKSAKIARANGLPGMPNPEIVLLERRGGRGGRPSRRGYRQQTGVRLRPPRRSELVQELARRRWLPAIYFIFSRSGCDQAVGHLAADGVVLTSTQERRQIRDVVEARVADLDSPDLDVLGYGSWLDGLLRGVAAHHAGMVPLFKETVEELFVDGLVKVCFATETLALGINMPARTVVIERLEKWDGQRHALLSPGQFTQLTGRAGRRGLDTLGHAVVLYQRDIEFPTVASLVGRRVEPLRSSFAPSYNMAVNLLRRHDRAEAELLLARSFAQFQADATVAEDEERIVRNREALDGYARNLVSERGDFREYWQLRRELSRLESESAAERRHRKTDAVQRALDDLREGDVVVLPRARGADRVAIVGRTTSRHGVPLASAVTEDRRLIRIGPREFDAPPVRVGRVRLPGRGGPRQSAWRKQVAAQVRGIDLPPVSKLREQVQADEELQRRIAEVRERVRSHPVHEDPRLSEAEVWAHRHDALLADTEKLERRVRRRTGSLVRQFERIIALLAQLEYVTAGDDPKPTPLGIVLAGLYAETDLLLAECVRRGVLGGLDPADLAAVASVFVHETRMKEPPPPVFPNQRVVQAVAAVLEVHDGLVALEEETGIAPTREPDAGFCDVVWRWASGADLDDALDGGDLTAGDFVRSTKQVADLLRQLRDAAAPMGIDEVAHTAQRALVRGVVAYSGV